MPVRTQFEVFHHRITADADIYLLRGRIRFLDPKRRVRTAPFSPMVLTLGAEFARREASVRRIWHDGCDRATSVSPWGDVHVAHNRTDDQVGLVALRFGRSTPVPTFRAARRM